MQPGRRRVLVAEDEALIGMMIEDELAQAGFEIVGPFATCADASHWLSTDTPDVAVLDHELRDGPCTDVAVELRRRGVRFAALTGSDRSKLPDVFLTAPHLTKPDSMERLPAILASLLVNAPG